MTTSQAIFVAIGLLAVVGGLFALTVGSGGIAIDFSLRVGRYEGKGKAPARAKEEAPPQDAPETRAAGRPRVQTMKCERAKGAAPVHVADVVNELVPGQRMTPTHPPPPPDARTR
jgi:hypothetical protein